jgi:phosphohistidine swiveling domain-containing protein
MKKIYNMKKGLSFLKKFKWQFFYGEAGHNMAVYMAAENRTKQMYEIFEVKFKVFFYTIKDNFFTMYANEKDWELVANHLLKKIIKQKNWLNKIFRNVYIRANRLLIFSRKLGKLDLDKLNNKQLFFLYKKFTDLFVDMRLYSSLPTNLEHSTPVFTQYLQSKLEKYILKTNPEFNRVFSTMTTPLKFSYLKNEELELYQLGLSLKDKNFDKKLKKFSDKFCWINYTFQGTPLGEKDFRNKIIEIAQKEIDLKAKIDKIKNDKNILKNEQQFFIKKYKFDQEIINLFSCAQELVFLKFFRKGIFAESYYYSEFLLDEIAKRLFTSRKIIQGMFFEEVESALLKEKFDFNKVLARIKNGCVLVCDGKSFDLDDKLRELVISNLEQTKAPNLNMIKGQVAMVGNAKGMVKIVNIDDDLVKMEESDVLVSRLTNPSLLPAMKKASAIVTDAGGLSCHAAIIARELKKPCVVGTKIATSVLKDGDLVEVDANNGIVRKINF